MRLILAPCCAWEPEVLNRLASFTSPKRLSVGDREGRRLVDRAVMNGESGMPAVSVGFDASQGSMRRVELLSKGGDWNSSLSGRLNGRGMAGVRFH